MFFGFFFCFSFLCLHWLSEAVGDDVGVGHWNFNGKLLATIPRTHCTDSVGSAAREWTEAIGGREAVFDAVI